MDGETDSPDDSTTSHEERIRNALRRLRWTLKTDEQHEALDELLNYLRSLDEQGRKEAVAELIKYLKEVIENAKPIN